MTGPWSKYQSKQGPWSKYKDPLDGLDFEQPAEQVRAQIAKLPEATRDKARNKWADAFVARERQNGGALQTADDTVRTLARGTFVGPFLDEFSAAATDPVAAVRAAISGNADEGSAPYYEALAYQRAQDRAVDTEAPILSTVGKVAGGLAGGIGAIRQASRQSPVSSVLVGGPLAAVPVSKSIYGNMAIGAGVGGTYGAAAAFGSGEGGFENRVKAADTGANVGAVLGAAFPLVGSAVGSGLNRAAEVVSPLAARASGAMTDIRNRVKFPAMSVAGPPPNQAAQSAGEQIIANQLSRANVRPEQLRQIVAQSEDASTFHSSGRAQNPLAVVDLDDSLARLAGSLGRQQPEVSNAAQAFNFARRTGYESGDALPANADLVTRPRLAALGKKDKPAGQFERVSDALKRALRIQDTRSHGHGSTARLTDRQIMQQAKDEAKSAYGALYKAGDGVNLTSSVEPVLARWYSQMADEPLPVARAIQRYLNQISRAVTTPGAKSHVERLDKVKQYMDSQIENLMPKTGATDRYMASILVQMKNNLLESLDSVTANNIGSLYREAREQFSDRMSMREALDAGRRVFKDGDEETVEAFLALPTRGHKKLYKQGLYDSFVQNIGRKRRTHDVTGIFETPRIQGILREVIERDKTTFSNRPERFGNYIANEQRMVRSQNMTHGGSPTARNLADDEALDGLQTMIDEVRRNPSATGLAMRAMETLLDRFFGVRPDTAAAIARMLYTTQPQERMRILLAIEQRMGPTRMSQFTQEMARYHRALTQASAVTTGGNVGGQ